MTSTSSGAASCCRAPANVWLGVTVENRSFVHRADDLRATPAAVRFVSAEPLLGPLLPPVCGWYVRDLGYVDKPGRYTGRHFEGEREAYAVRDSPEVFGSPGLDLGSIDWLIVGGESNGRAGRRLVDDRNEPIPERLGWVRDLRDACLLQRDVCRVCGGFGALDALHGGPAHMAGPTIPCPQRHTAFFFKQFGGRKPTSGGRMLDDREWNEFPR